MHRNVELLIGRLITDPRLRHRFVNDATGVLREFRDQGLELTDIELAALAAIDPEALRAFAASIDRRLCKAPHAFVPDAMSGRTDSNETR